MTTIRVSAERSDLELTLAWAATSPVTMSLRAPAEDGARAFRSAEAGQPLVEALAAGHGREWSGRRMIDTSIGQRLRYREHHLSREGAWQTLEITQSDEITGLEFTSSLSMHDDQLGVRSHTSVVNTGGEPVTLHAVTSLVFSDFEVTSNSDLDRLILLRGHSDWLAEGRWAERPLRVAGLPNLSFGQRPFRSRGCLEASSLSSWSTAGELPVGAVTDPRTRRRWSFQVEHNGPWVWQIGELLDGLYLALSGPTDEHHQWQLALQPGETFTTVPASVTLEVAADGPPALSALTDFRRASRPAASRTDGLVIFNDYMNTVNGDPSADTLLPLVDAAADLGADVFVIDAGWYADDGDWWDTVGEWQPSARRFPNGLDEVLDRVRHRGMRPGLWLEPEAVGVASPVAGKLPDEAFLSRGGVRVVDHGRFHLDLSCPAALAHLDDVVDRLVSEHGVGYFKLDYNIRAGAGSDAATPSPGHGLLRHNRAYLQWISSVRDRHPDLILENCASGGMRADFATTSRFDLQSTSDQEDLHAYAPIAAVAPMLVVPEQAGNWAYPQPDMSSDDVIFTLCTAMLGRLYLSGWINRLTTGHAALVSAAVTANRQLQTRLGSTTPFWPLGLPGWSDEWVALGLRDSTRGHAERHRGDSGNLKDADSSPSCLYVTIWKRSPAVQHIVLNLPPPPRGQRWRAPTPVFPDQSPLTVELTSDTTLQVADPDGGLAARVVRLVSDRR